jgi:hypothetical protein
MKSIFLTIAAVAFAGIIFAGAELQASSPKGGGGKGSKGSSASKASRGSNGNRGSKAPHKAHQPSKAHNHNHNHNHHRNHHRNYRGWSRYCWFPTYGCYGFYDPSCECWYYWYEPAGEFQPIESMATNVPATSGAALLPPGAVEMPRSGTSTLAK